MWTWSEIQLRDAKTEARSVALSPAARIALAGIPRLPDNPWVIAGAKPGTRLSSLNNAWLVIRARADLKDVRIHDLRHSFTSRALVLGESLPMIGRMLGHRKVQTTAHYAHLARDSVKASAARVPRASGRTWRAKPPPHPARHDRPPYTRPLHLRRRRCLGCRGRRPGQDVARPDRRP